MDRNDPYEFPLAYRLEVARRALASILCACESKVLTDAIGTVHDLAKEALGFVDGGPTGACPQIWVEELFTLVWGEWLPSKLAQRSAMVHIKDNGPGPYLIFTLPEELPDHRGVTECILGQRFTLKPTDQNTREK